MKKRRLALTLCCAFALGLSGYDSEPATTTAAVVAPASTSATTTAGATTSLPASVNAWISLNPSGDLPSPRDSQSMIYDSRTGKVILFGGVQPPTWVRYDDIWSYGG